MTVLDLLSVTLRRDPHLRMPESPLDPLMDAIALRSLRRADAIIAISHYSKEVAVREARLPPSLVQVIHCGVDTEIFRPRDVRRFRGAARGLDPASRWVLYVGSEQPRKNFLTLIRAFAELRRDRPDVRLVKVGSAEVGAEREKAVTLARNLGVLQDILFLPHSHEDLPAYFGAANLFVFPSLAEGFGFPPLEAMACGAPVVCANTTSLPEVVGTLR